VRELEKRGLRIRKVIVDLEELVEFCKREKTKLNAEARTHYVARKLEQEDRANPLAEA
jgi:hypothetical protein